MTAASNTSYEVSAYLRVASLAIAGYDYLQTLPFELRIWREAWKGRQLTLSSTLFLLIRLQLGMALHCSESNHGVHRTNWKVGVQIKRILAVHLKCDSSCGSHSPTSAWGGWVSYVVAIIYNFVTTVVCVFFLLKMKTSNGSMMSRVTRMMLVDGLWYFVVLTAINFVNLLFNRLTSLSELVQQTAAYDALYPDGNLRLIHKIPELPWVTVHDRNLSWAEVSVERRNESINAAVTITQRITTARNVSHAIRSQYESKSARGFDLTVPDFDLESAHYGAPVTEEDAEVHVRIERTVRMERMPRVYDLEDYSRNRSTH
ncbi:hypothetical protein MVEN_02213100 [Mycena venus]|uniref:DUF6533 domain-containing protein n=1 Tax=Mycena venus TaxID=2733690 RepID=A0A8H6X709_9AGAR|nr:hypothetical protein MVEN_02213100 [Mycena venus]